MTKLISIDWDQDILTFSNPSGKEHTLSQTAADNIQAHNPIWTAGDDGGGDDGGGRLLSADGGLLLHNDITIIHTDNYAKGGNGGGGGKPGGGGGGGGGGDTGTLDKYISGPDGGYNIEINFKGTWTVDLQQDFIDSSELLSSLIVGDIADVRFRGKTIDDVKIDATLKEIDGEGGILGRAGPTAVRTDGYLPATAIMEFDIADAATFDALGLWGDIVLHEMIHSIGFGEYVWSNLGLISGANGDNPEFTGANAISEYEATFGLVDQNGVPLEQDGGEGTRDSHWDEETFNNELMTGYLNAEGNTLSDMSVAALEDMGYDTVWT